jgi:hypothetical protein
MAKASFKEQNEFLGSLYHFCYRDNEKRPAGAGLSGRLAGEGVFGFGRSAATEVTFGFVLCENRGHLTVEERVNFFEPLGDVFVDSAFARGKMGGGSAKGTVGINDVLGFATGALGN